MTRFRIDEAPKDLSKWLFSDVDNYAVVDEEAGGVIAYFSVERDAQLFVKALQEDEA